MAWYQLVDADDYDSDDDDEMVGWHIVDVEDYYSIIFLHLNLQSPKELTSHKDVGL